MFWPFFVRSVWSALCFASSRSAVFVDLGSALVCLVGSAMTGSPPCSALSEGARDVPGGNGVGAADPGFRGGRLGPSFLGNVVSVTRSRARGMPWLARPFPYLRALAAREPVAWRLRRKAARRRRCADRCCGERWWVYLSRRPPGVC